MELDATTFALEIVNFLVLLWLLWRFLYRPMQRALDARAQAAAQLLRQQDERKAALDARDAALERQQLELAARQSAAEHDLLGEIDAQRQKLLTGLKRDLEAERQRAMARLDQELQNARLQTDVQLRQRAADFVAGYLRRLANPAVEATVIELFLADLAHQPQQARAALRDGRDARHEDAAHIDIATVYAPGDALRARVEQAICELMGEAPQAIPRIEWRLDPSLLAGIRVHLPGHQIEASLQRGVDAFGEESV